VINSSVLFDGKRAQQTKWTILTSSVHGEVSYIVADATSSYDAVADQYRRWVILLPQYGVLMLDEFQTSASNYRLRFNNAAKFQFDENPLDKHFESISLSAEFIVPDARGPVQVHVSNWPSIEPVTISQQQATGPQPWQLEVKSDLEQNYAHSQYIITWIEDPPHKCYFRGVSGRWEESKVTFTVNNRTSGSNAGFTVDFGKMTVNRTK
jgi:hypothetical protein